MNKRFRKKMHRGEYCTYVFTVKGISSRDISNKLLDWADSQGYMIGGLVGDGDGKLDFVVDRCSNKKCTCGKYYPFGASETDREIIQKWLESHDCTNVRCSILWDGHYGRSPFEGEDK